MFAARIGSVLVERALVLGFVIFLFLAVRPEVCRADESVTIADVHSQVVQQSDEFAYVAWKARILSQITTRAFVTVSFFGTQGFRMRYFIDLVELQKGENRIQGLEKLQWHQYWDLRDIRIEVEPLQP